MGKERIFQIGDVVKHFKRETVDPESDDYRYRILNFAEHTKTGEILVIYCWNQNARDFSREMNDEGTIHTARFCIQNIV